MKESIIVDINYSLRSVSFYYVANSTLVNSATASPSCDAFNSQCRVERMKNRTDISVCLCVLCVVWCVCECICISITTKKHPFTKRLEFVNNNLPHHPKSPFHNAFRVELDSLKMTHRQLLEDSRNFVIVL